MGFYTITNGQKVSSWRNNINANLYELYNLYIPLSATSMTWDIKGRVNFLTYTEKKTDASIVTNTLNLDFKQGSFFKVTVNQNITNFTFSNIPPAGKLTTFTLQTVGNGTAYTINWGINKFWRNSIVPTYTSTLNRSDIFRFKSYDGGTNWIASRDGRNFQ